MEVNRTLNAAIDDKGSYEIRVGPGRYRLRMPHWFPDGGEFEVKVADQPELVYDEIAAWPERMRISGRVVSAASGKAVAGAIVESVPIGRVDLISQAD